MLDYSIPLSETANVVGQLKATGRSSAFAVLMFAPPQSHPGPAETINLQYSIEDESVGLDWVLMGQRNIADKDELTAFIQERGYTVKERELNEVSFLRVEDGDLTALGLSIATEFYRQAMDTSVGLLVDKFVYQTSQESQDGMEFSRNAGRRVGHETEVSRVAAMLRLIAGKATRVGDDGFPAHSGFLCNGNYFWISDEIADDGTHQFRLAVSSNPSIREVERQLRETHGIELMSACGYGRSYYDDGDYVRLIQLPVDSAGFNALAEHVVGILDLLFSLHPEDSIVFDFFVPPMTFAELPKVSDLPNWFQTDYAEFKARYYQAMQYYNKLMAREPGDPFDATTGYPIQVCEEMQAILDLYPSFLKTFETLDGTYAYFLKVAKDEHILMTESLYLLRRCYCAMLFH